MPNIVEVTDLTCPELAVFTRLTEAQLRNRLEPEKGIFIAESPKVIARALDAGCVPVSLLMERRHIAGDAASILVRCGDVPVFTAEREVLAQLTGFALTRGVLCAMQRPRLPAVEALCAGAHRVAVLEGIVDPTNVGAIFRSAAALHMDAVLVTPTCCDPLYRRAARVSMGTIFQVPWTRIGERAPEEDLDIEPDLFLEEEMTEEEDIDVDNLELSMPEGVSIEDPVLQEADKLAIVLGTEGDGLAEETIARCDHTVCIPMSHGVDSLNVAAASAVAFWELRYRRGSRPV